MKNYIVLLLLFAGVISFSACTVQGRIVATRPADVYYSRPPAPGPDFIWISGDWVWVGGRYEWHEGRWERPHNGRRWEEGRWESHGDGWRWRRGHWR